MNADPDPQALFSVSYQSRLTCSSPEKAAEELGAETVLLPLEESGRVGGDPGGCCCDPLSGAPSQSRLRRMDGLGERKTTTGYT